MTINTPEQRCSCLKNTEKWHFVKPTITNLEAILQLWKLTFDSHLRITGQESILTFSSIQKPASLANAANLPRTNHRHCIHYQCRTNLTFGYMLISLGPCWQPVASTNTSCASRTLSQNTPSSLQWKIKKQKLWLRPFFLNGFVNSASQRRFTLMAGKSLLINYLKNYLTY